MTEIEKLEDVIVKNSEAYYSGRPCLPDDVFDHYVKRLYELDPSNKVILSTGWGMKVDEENKHPHKYGKVIGIPDKIRPEDVSKKVKTWNIEDRGFWISPKLDGASVLLYYEKGKLVDAISRGDGEYGMRILSKVNKCVPEKIDSTFTGRIRGEFIIDKYKWDKLYSKDNKSARNFGAGLLSRKTDYEKDCKNFDVVCYTVLNAYYNLTFKEQQEFLNENGFVSVPYMFEKSLEKIDLVKCEEILSTLNRDTYECDGLVIDSEDKQFAIKWNSSGVETIVKGIEWNISRLGKIIPVVHIEPVEVSGATISKVAGNNFEYILSNKIGEDSVIKVIRSGDVIPYITEVISESNKQNIPDVCPSCGSLLKHVGVNLICDNINCPAKGIGGVIHFVENVCPVDGIAESILSNLLKHFKIFSPVSFISFCNTVSSFEILRFCNSAKGLGTSTYKKLTRMINVVRNESLPFKKVLLGLGLPALGEKTIDKIVDNFCDLSWIDNAGSAEFINNINSSGISYVAFESLATYKDDIQLIINTFNNKPYVTRKITDINYDIKICITGPLSVSRREFLEECKEIGIIESSIAKADILITNTPDSGTEKNKQAQSRGTTIMTEEAFRKEYLNNEVRQIVN